MVGAAALKFREEATLAHPRKNTKSHHWFAGRIHSESGLQLHVSNAAVVGLRGNGIAEGAEILVTQRQLKNPVKVVQEVDVPLKAGLIVIDESRLSVGLDRTLGESL